MTNSRASVYLLSLVSLVVLFVPCNLLAQDEGEEPCCYDEPYTPDIDLDGQSGSPQDDGNEPCCYIASPSATLDPFVQSGSPQDDGNEPCCYNASHDSLIKVNDQRPALLSGRKLGQTDLVWLPQFALTVHPTAVSVEAAFLREKEIKVH